MLRSASRIVLVTFLFALARVATARFARNYATEEHKLPWCTPDNLNFQNTSSGEFFLLRDGSFKYYLPHCKLRRFKSREAAKCLQGNHLVFMGDSLTRYFYLNLAAFLAQGRWSHHFVDQFPHGLSFLSEKEFKSWSWFYEETNLALNKWKRSVEICDCFRNDTQPFDEFIRDMFENRHFRHIPSLDLNTNVTDVRLSYIQWWGLMPMRGHKSISLAAPRSEKIGPFLQELNNQMCPARPDRFWPLTRDCAKQRKDLFTIDFPAFSYKELCTEYPHPTLSPETKDDMCQKFERDILAPLGTTHLILNTGWHAGLEHVGPKFLPKVIDAAQKYFAPIPADSPLKHTLPRVTWRQTTTGAVFEDNDKIALQVKRFTPANHFGFLPVGEITKKLRVLHDLMEANNIATLRRLVHKHPSFPPELDVNLTTVRNIWHDPAHFEPYVYNEINNMFLNAICPLATAPV